MNIDGLNRYIESISIDRKFIKKADSNQLTESLAKIPNKLRESLSGDTAKGWWVPISIYDRLNGNGRIYSKALWENVRDKQKSVWCGSPMLMDHPSGDSDGNPRDICGVWLDMRIDPPCMDGTGLVYGLLMPSGRNGEDLQAHLQNGLRVGTSTSGFGKLKKDGITVDPDTFQIERLADFVLNPSAGTFFSYDESEDNIINSSNNITESVENNLNNIEEAITKETIVKDSKFTKLEEKKFRRDMESFLESANNIKDPQERLDEFKEIKSYLEDGACPDLREAVEAKIVEQEALIKQMLAESIELKEELGIESTKDLKEKLTRIAEDVKINEKEAQDWKTVSENLQKKLQEANETINSRATAEYTEYQKKKIASLTEKMSSQSKEAAELIKDLTAAYKSMKEACAEKDAKIAELTESNTTYSSQITETNSSIINSITDHNKLKEHCAAVEKELSETKEMLKTYESLANKQRTRIEEFVGKVSDANKLNEKKSQQVNQLAAEVKDSQKKLKTIAVSKIQENRQNSSVTEVYFEKLYKQYGNEVLPYKERIAGARTLAEAKSYFFKEVLQNLNESKNIAKTYIPESLDVEPTDRVKCFGDASFYKEDAISRLPKGWK